MDLRQIAAAPPVVIAAAKAASIAECIRMKSCTVWAAREIGGAALRATRSKRTEAWTHEKKNKEVCTSTDDELTNIRM